MTPDPATRESPRAVTKTQHSQKKKKETRSEECCDLDVVTAVPRGALFAESGSSRHKAPCPKRPVVTFPSPPTYGNVVEHGHPPLLTADLPRTRTRKSMLFTVTQRDREAAQFK